MNLSILAIFPDFLAMKCLESPISLRHLFLKKRVIEFDLVHKINNVMI